MADEWAKTDEKLKGKNELRKLVPYPLEFKHTDDGDVDEKLLALDHPLWIELKLYRDGLYDPDMKDNVPKKKGQHLYRVDSSLKSISEKLTAYNLRRYGLR